jgi:hypothetical protein
MSKKSLLGGTEDTGANGWFPLSLMESEAMDCGEIGCGPDGGSGREILGCLELSEDLPVLGMELVSSLSNLV